MRACALIFSLAFFFACALAVPVPEFTDGGHLAFVATAHATKRMTHVREYRKKNGKRVKETLIK